MGAEIKETNVDTGNAVGTEESTNTEAQTKGDTNEVITEPSDTKPEGIATDKTEENTKDENIMIPKKRFDEVNENYKSIKQELQALKELNTPKEQEQPQQQEQNETELPEAYTALEEKVKQFESVIDEMVNTKVKDIPEEYQDLVPEGLSNEGKLAWINKAEEKGLFTKEKAQIPVGQPTNHSANQADEEARKKMNPIQLLASYYGKDK